MSRRRLYLFGLIVLLSQAGGCVTIPAYQLVLWGASGISYMASGKSITDHALSSATKRDCALLRILSGRPACSGVEADSSQIVASSNPAPRTDQASPARSPGDPVPDFESQPTVPVFSEDGRLEPSEGSRFLVVGSYERILNAIAHAERKLHSQVVESIVEDKTYYRVVIGPMRLDGDALASPAELEGAWALRLCVTDLSPPPCENRTLALSSLDAVGLN